MSNEVNNIPQVQEILIGCISPSPMNPRKTFNEDAIRELADNIRQQGLLQPITVRHETYKDDAGNVHRIENAFEIICGERRYRACKLISPIMNVPCIVRDMSDEEAFDAMITENLQRRDVDPMEEAVAFRLLSERGTKADELAARFGKSVRYINDRIRLSMLHETLREAVSDGRITLRGGYLLARLNQADQQAFIEEEYAEDYDFTTSDIEDWLDRHFMNLWRAPFQDGESLKETWNPDGQLIRRCDSCECNTCNHGCLFADIKTDEPQCIDEVCYARKLDIYYDWFIRQHRSRIIIADKPANAASIALYQDDGYYREDTKERIRQIADKLKSQGFRIFTSKELPSFVWNEKEQQGAINDGTAVECIDITEMARGGNLRISVRRIAGATASRPADPEKPSNYPAQLAERSAAIQSTAEKKIASYNRKNFDRDKYVADTRSLESWELVMLDAILFERLSYDDRNALIPDARWKTPTFGQMVTLHTETNFANSWRRKAIASFFTGQQHEGFLEEAMKHLSIEARSFIDTTRNMAGKRIQDINEELHELGYDENANKI